MKDKTRQRIEYELIHWDDENSTARKRFEAAKEEWDIALKPLQDAITASERITEKDLLLRIID